MSRAAAATSQKGAQKAAMKDKAATHAADLAMGLTSTMKKLMASDTLLCMSCHATALGPKLSCGCPGGRTKPPADYDAKNELLAAAMAREKARKDGTRGAAAAQQGSVQAAKAKSKAERDNVDGLADLDLSSLDLVDVEFEPGVKLGMSIERNCVKEVAADGTAEQKKVRVGWVLRKVNGTEVPPSKEKIMQLCAKGMKSGNLTITFQTPLDDDAPYYCKDCDKFLATDAFEGATNGPDAGPGVAVCVSCEEYADSARAKANQRSNRDATTIRARRRELRSHARSAHACGCCFGARVPVVLKSKQCLDSAGSR